MEEGVTSTDVLAFQEQRRHETEKRKRVEEIAGGKEDGRASKERGANEEEKGIIANFISNLVPRNRETADNEAQDDRMDRGGGGGKGRCKLEEDLGGANNGDGGIVNNLISRPTEAREREEEERNEKEERVFDVKIEEEGGDGGGSGEGERRGIIETLVSHLPKTLPGDSSSSDYDENFYTGLCRDKQEHLHLQELSRHEGHRGKQQLLQNELLSRHLEHGQGQHPPFGIKQLKHEQEPRRLQPQQRGLSSLGTQPTRQIHEKLKQVAPLHSKGVM